MNKTFSKNLKKLRLSNNYTQEQVAEKLGVSAQSISRWECGTTLPDVLLLPEIARLYCVTVDDLYKETSVAYPNYAQRLASVYEYSRKPEDFMQADLEFRKLFQSKEYEAEDVRVYGVLHHFMMKYCRDKAIQLFDEIIADEADGDGQAYYRTRGQKIELLSDIGRIEEAIHEQLESVQKEINIWQEYGLLIDAYCHAGEYQMAYEWFKKAVKRFPEEWALYVSGGDICKKLKRYEQAFEYWDKALEINSKYIDAKYSKAFTYEELGRYDKAYQSWCEIAEELKAGGYDIEAQAELERSEKCKEKKANGEKENEYIQ